MKRKAQATWHGDLKNGSGKMQIDSVNLDADYTFLSRFEEGKGTNPEELLGAAHAGCFSMALANTVAGQGFTPEKVTTEALVTLSRDEKGFYISKIELDTTALIPDIDMETFSKLAEETKVNCPISRALAVAEVEVNLTLNA